MTFATIGVLAALGIVASPAVATAAPVAVADSATIAQDAAATPIDVLANDTGGPFTITATTQPVHGLVAFTASSLTYTPDPEFCGPDPFTYTLNGGSAATVSVTVTCAPDTTPPNTSFTKKPAKRGHKVLAKFGFGSTEAGSTFLCKLDREPFRSCTSPYSKTVAAGRHTLEVKAVDTAGNADKTPATFSWTVLPHKH